MLIVTVTQLRKAGARMAKPDAPAQGYLRSKAEGSFVGLELISDRGGITMAGPLYDPRMIKADQDGFILLGFERHGEASVVQEWLVKAAPIGSPTAYITPQHPRHQPA